ncbi:MAG: hypothetical protein JWM87_3737 [Candidatus Eremiobacteraeota bacterium]|nr:hypothetical protein [Candidatus Eremiobacteraeota bacterium]
MSTDKRVKLRGVLDHTASSAEIDTAGDLVVELYDFSDDAHTWLGNDVAFQLVLDAAGKDAVLQRLRSADAAPAGADNDELLLGLVQERFCDYYAMKQWLEEQGIPYRKVFEPWA